jgi:hypothetical protein
VAVKQLPSGKWYMDFVAKGVRHAQAIDCTTEKKAKEFERKYRDDLALGRQSLIAAMPLKEACSKFWTEVGERRGDATEVWHRLKIVQRLLGEDTPLGKIGQYEINQAIVRRRGETYKKGKDRIGRGGKLIKAKEYPLTDSTVNRDIIETLRPVLRRARSHWTPTGTVHGLPDIDWTILRLSEPRGLVQTYTPAERAAWIEAAKVWGDDIDLGVDMLLTYGMRFGELFFPLSALRFDPDKPTLVLQKGRKVDVYHEIPLSPEHARRLAARYAQAKAAKLPHVWFYLEGRDRKAFTPGMVEYRISKAADNAGLQQARRIHGMRHDSATAILAKSGNMKVAQALLGHASMSSTQRYAHASTDQVREHLHGKASPQIHHSDLPESLKSQLG